MCQARQRDLGVSADAAKREFPQRGTLVDFLWKSGAQGIGNLKDGAEHTLRQGIQVSVFIGG